MEQAQLKKNNILISINWNNIRKKSQIKQYFPQYDCLYHKKYRSLPLCIFSGGSGDSELNSIIVTYINKIRKQERSVIFFKIIQKSVGSLRITDIYLWTHLQVINAERLFRQQL